MKYKYGQILLYFCLLIAAIATMTLTRKCSPGKALPALTRGNSQGDTIDAAIIYGPLSYYLYDDTIGGINYDLLNAYSKETGRPVKMWPVISLASALKKLEKGTYDILASLPADNSVKQRFLTTRSVFLDELVLIQLADSDGNIKVKSALDLAGDTIHIQADSPADARLSNLANEIGAPIKVIREKDLSEEYLCMKVATGDFLYAVVNKKMAEAMQKRYPALSYDNPVSFTQFQVWLINKNDSTTTDSVLLKSIDTWLMEYQKTAAYQELLEKY